MDTPVLLKMIEMSQKPEEQEKTVRYLQQKISRFVKQGDKVLISFPDHSPGSLSDLYSRAVKACGAVPVIWGPDKRWKTLLQQAFFSRANTVIGLPFVILGLAKLKKHSGLPIYLRNVVTAGYPCLDWMIDGIQKGLDCTGWGSFSITTTSVVAGFSCDDSSGVHLRDDCFGIDIVDASGNVLPEGSFGDMVLYPLADPTLRYSMGERGRLEHKPCTCGCASPRVMDLYPGKNDDPELVDLGQYLHSWTSVLDCNLVRGSYGLEIELVVFTGEKLPKLPSAAKQVIRPWDPKHDKPFFYKPLFLR